MTGHNKSPSYIACNELIPIMTIKSSFEFCRGLKRVHCNEYVVRMHVSKMTEPWCDNNILKEGTLIFIELNGQSKKSEGYYHGKNSH